MVGSNIILSLLFIYMAEQVTVRTDQYRSLATQIETNDGRVTKLENEIKFLEKQNRNLIESFGLTTVKLDTKTILSEYDKYSAEVKKLDEDLRKATELLRETNDQSK